MYPPHEIRRKWLHLSSLYIPGIYWFISRELAVSIIVPITICLLAMDLLRLRYNRWNTRFKRIFGALMREGEDRKLTGATYFLSSCALSIILFPKGIAVASMLILIISDTLAAFVGFRFGRIRLFNKTLEGSCAFFLSATLIAATTAGVPLFSGLLGALAATSVEVLPIPIDDNLSSPLTAGTIMTLIG